MISAAVNGDQSSLPGGENGKRLMGTEQGGEQLLRNHTLLIILLSHILLVLFSLSLLSSLTTSLSYVFCLVFYLARSWQE